MAKTKEYREKQTSKQANMFALVSSLRIPEPYLLLKNPETFLLFGEGRLLINLPRNRLSIANTSSVQLLSPVQLCVTPRTVAHQAPLSITNFHSLLKLISIESVIDSISSSVILFSFCLQTFPALGSFARVSSLHQVAKVL